MMGLAEVDYDDEPRNLEDEIIQSIGLRAAIALADAFAGTRLYIPKRMTDNHKIVRAVNRDAADALCKRFAALTICVPLMRTHRARFYRKMGMSKGKIALRLGITEKGVQKLFRRASRPV